MSIFSLVVAPPNQNISTTRIDNLGKAKGFAEYARQNPGVGRIQLIRKGKDATGHDRFKRLDMAKSAVRDKVSHAMTNDELDHIFDEAELKKKDIELHYTDLRTQLRHTAF